MIRQLYGGLILLIILLAALYVPLKLPFEAESIGRIYPAQEWRLVQDQAGRISSVIRDYRSGAVLQMDAYQFAQGDISGMKFDIPVPDSGAYIRTGDTIVRMYSIRQNEEIQNLEAQLALYAAQLQAEKTGDKPPIVQEAENKLHFAEQDLTQKEQLYKIKKQLKDEGVIALTEFQVAENDFKLAQIQIDIARKYLENVSSGLKSESVGITEAQLNGLRNRLSLLRQKGLSFVLRAPFSGYLTPTTLPEEMLILNRSDEYAALIPIKVEYLQYLKPGSVITVTDIRTQKNYKARLLNTGGKVEVLDNRQLAMLMAVLTPADDSKERISTGVAANCRVRFDEVNQREYLRRIFNFR